MRVKICGLTCLEDAVLADELGADYLGFIFYSKSPRHIGPFKAAKILEQLHGKAKAVGVFVNENIEEIKKIITETGIKNIQLHGNEKQPVINELINSGCKIIKTVSILNEKSFEELEQYNSVTFLLDTWHPSLKGGSGKKFDWALLEGKDHLVKKSIIAGGLNAETVLDLLKRFSPSGIDVASGVEEYPGKKNPEKLKKFFDIIKNYNENSE